MANFYNPLPHGSVLHGNQYYYKIEKTLGQGTFGISYLAKVNLQGELGKLDSYVYVAIKEFFIKEINGREGTCVTVSSSGAGGLFYDYKQKFAREAKNLSNLKHANIVKVMDYFEDNNTCYYVMEYLSGGDLDTLIEKRKGLSEEDTIRFTKQIGSALSFMHQNKMLHLDLKPKNVMLNAAGDAILIDFGLSKQYDSSGEPESSTTVGRGTPGYAPLEQTNYKDDHDFPVTMDVYALGATIYKMFVGERVPAAFEILNDGFPTQILSAKCSLKEVVACVEKAMAPLKKERYQSVNELLKAVAMCIDSTSKDKEHAHTIGKSDVLDTKVETTIINPVNKTLTNTNSSTGIHNGYEWVDLGLPSGTKWATMNVGAKSPSDYGYYFAWGETKPKSSYTSENYKYIKCPNKFLKLLVTLGDKLTKYNTNREFGKVDGKKELDLCDDAAHDNWGSGWRMPNKSQQDELRNKCRWVFTMMDGHKGYNVVGPNGNHIFLPADGRLYENNSDREYGSYWSRSLDLKGLWRAFGLDFDSSGVFADYDDREKGRCVRAVLTSRNLFGIKDNNKGDNYDEIPEGKGEFGICISNPVPINGISANESYLKKLITSDGMTISWKRKGSGLAENIDKPIDIYSIIDSSGSERPTIYISPYHPSTSTKAPVGYKFK